MVTAPEIVVVPRHSPRERPGGDMDAVTVAIYSRISHDPEGRQAGVERQEQDCRKMAADRGCRYNRLDVEPSTSGQLDQPLVLERSPCQPGSRVGQKHVHPTGGHVLHQLLEDGAALLGSGGGADIVLSIHGLQDHHSELPTGGRSRGYWRSSTRQRRPAMTTTPSTRLRKCCDDHLRPPRLRAVVSSAARVHGKGTCQRCGALRGGSGSTLPPVRWIAPAMEQVSAGQVLINSVQVLAEPSVVAAIHPYEQSDRHEHRHRK